MRAAFATIIITCFVLTALSSCGGDSQPLAVTEPTAAYAGMEESLPELPEGSRFHPGKIVAAASVTRPGHTALDHSANVTIAVPQALMNPAAGELAWVVYEFSGSPADIITSIGYSVSNRPAGHQVWMAIGDYSSNSWEILEAQDADTATLPVAGTGGDHTSSLGHVHIAMLAWDGQGYDVDEITVTYENRYTVSGKVSERSGVGIPDVLVTTSLGGPNAITDAAGDYTLMFVPEGTWHVMCTKAGWVFYDYPQEFTVAGGPATGVNMLGEPDLSHWKPVDPNEPNDYFDQAPALDPSTAVNAYISAIDDPRDFYRFSLPAAGFYRFELNGDPTLLFPSLYVYDGTGVLLETSGWIGAGLTVVGITTAVAMDVVVKVEYYGGGGQYTLQIVNGLTYELEGEVHSGINDIGYIKLKADDGTVNGVCYFYTQSFNGAYGSDHMRNLSTEITPDPDGESPYTMWAPVPPLIAPLQLGDVTGADFSCNSLLFDNYEPNDTKATAHPLTLPVTSHDPVSIRGADPDDWYSVTPAAGNYLLVRVDLSYYSSWGAPFSLSVENGGPAMYGYNTATGMEVRTQLPCDGSDYYIHIYSWADTHFPYTMTIEEFTGYNCTVGVGYLWDGVEGAIVNLYNYDTGWTWTGWTNVSGRYDCIYPLIDGETVFAEVFRYGLSCNRHTKALTVNGADVLQLFNGDETSADSLEPNNNDVDATEVTLPANFRATICSSTDYYDKYRLFLTDSDPLHVVFTDGEPWLEYHADLWDVPNAVQTDTKTWTGDLDFSLGTGGPVEHILQIYVWDGKSSYRLQLD